MKFQFHYWQTHALFVGMLQKRSKELEGKIVGHEVHHKTEELLRKTLNNPLMHSAPFYSIHWQDPVMCYWQRKSLQSKDKELTERENLFAGLFPYNIYKHILIFHFLSLRLVKPKAAGESHSSSSALQWLNFRCVLPVSWPLLLTASCPVSYASCNRKS